MNNPPSIESCQQLHKLAPGWTDTERWYTPLSTGEIVVTDWQKATIVGMNRSVPLYDTDYLLEKLPKLIEHEGLYYKLVIRWLGDDDMRPQYWSDVANKRLFSTDTNTGALGQGKPAEALIRLATTLIQEGKLKP